MKKSLHKVVYFVVAFAVVLGLSPLGRSTQAPQFSSNNTFRFVIQTNVQNPYRLTELSRWLESNNFDVTGLNWHKGQVEVVTDNEGVNFLKGRGLQGHSIDTEAALDPRFLNPQTVEAHLKALNQTYPSLTRLEQIGRSVQGRPIWALLISDTAASPNDSLSKPSIIFDGQHHAREVMTSEIVTDVADALLTSAASSPIVKNWIQRWNIWIVPMINVDGTNIVFTQNNMWRKNARADGSDLYGVDINRNYPYRWAGCNGSSDFKFSETYHGSSAASEPETQAMVKLAQRIRPTASLSYHSFSEFVLYPYGCGGQSTPEQVLVEKIGAELAAQLPSDDGRGHYTPGTPWQLLYDVDGGSMDYYYASFGALAYTFEVNQEFQPSYSMRAPTLQKHRSAWAYFLGRIDRNLLHVRVVDKNSAPAEALVAISSIHASAGELPLMTNKLGHFFKVLDPGTYEISVQLADGRVGSEEVQMTGSPQEVQIQIP